MFYATTVPNAIEDITLSQLISVIVFLIVIIGAIVTFARRLRPWSDAIKHFLDDWNGVEERPGVPERLGVMERLEKLEQNQKLTDIKVSNVLHEVVPNGGGSLADTVNRVERHLITQRGEE